jgi:hypothetical protein
MAADRPANGATRFAVSTATFALLVLLASSCGALPRSHAPAASGPAATAQPVGNPSIFGWDGVSGRILMYRLESFPHGSFGNFHVDTSTWVFTGSEWAVASSAESIPAINAINGVLVYDSTRHREVLVAAGDPYVPAPEVGTWEWDGKAWNVVSSVHSLPFLTQSVSAAYSPELHATVLIDFCASGLNKPQGQTLLFNGTDWVSLTPANWPGCGAQVAYSPSRHSIIALAPDYQTWRFDGTDWSPITTGGTTIPAITTGMGRQAPVVALDQKDDKWVVFGGFDGATSFADTWIGNGSDWVKQPSGLSPSSRFCGPRPSCMTWDPSLGALVLFGGPAGPNGPSLGDTWSWNGRSWVQLAGPIYPETPSPSAAPFPTDVASAPRLTSPEPTSSATSPARTTTP